jgi:hypothetical protein
LGVAEPQLSGEVISLAGPQAGIGTRMAADLPDCFFTSISLSCANQVHAATAQ